MRSTRCLKRNARLNRELGALVLFNARAVGTLLRAAQNAGHFGGRHLFQRLQYSDLMLQLLYGFHAAEQRVDVLTPGEAKAIFDGCYVLLSDFAHRVALHRQHSQPFCADFREYVVDKAQVMLIDQVHRVLYRFPTIAGAEQALMHFGVLVASETDVPHFALFFGFDECLRH